jgi:hypothetical protein
VFQDGEEGVVQTRFGGVANAAIDPDLKNSFADEASVFLEREVIPDLGVRVGFVWKKDNDGWQQVNTLRPLDAFNVPVTIIDPGPDGSVATTADNGTFAFLNLDDPNRGSSQFTTNIDGYEGTYKTIELSANKRYSSRWSLNASFSRTWTHEFGNNYANNRFGTAISNFSFFGSYPSTPIGFQGRETDSLRSPRETRPVHGPVQRAELGHRGEHQLAVRRVVREGNHGDWTADRQVRSKGGLVIRSIPVVRLTPQVTDAARWQRRAGVRAARCV